MLAPRGGTAHEAEHTLAADPRRLSLLSHAAEKNASNTHGPSIISGCRRSSGCAHRGKVFPQFHLRQSTGSTHTGKLYFSCGQVVVRHDPAHGREEVYLR
jgi:hypothetical protein